MTQRPVWSGGIFPLILNFLTLTLDGGERWAQCPNHTQKTAGCKAFEKTKSEHQFPGCPAYNPITIPICFMASIQKEAYLIISILTPIHRSILQKFFPSPRPKHIQIYFSTGTKLKDSSIPRRYAMSTNNCYRPLKKSVPSSSRSFSMALDHRQLYTSAKLLWKPQIWQGQNTIQTHTHSAPNNIHLQHMMLQAGASPLQAGTDLQQQVLHHCFGHVL